MSKLLKKATKRIMNGKVRIDRGIKFPSIASRSFLTEKDRLKVKSEEIKPKIMDLLEEKDELEISDLLKSLDANIIEIKIALKDLEKEGKIAYLE